KIIRLSENINAKGYNYAECIEQEKCTACKMCYITCPDVAITIEK
ncbi:MAG: 4Fe-4S binding protein, partial [Candidatus Cloacimonas sp.]|nr:4Fe-4S binding protein [Candidatus Cloacimonas sp.]